MRRAKQTCAGCGRDLPAASSRCPECSKSTVLVASETLPDSGDLSSLFPAESPLHECGPCERLVEAQNHQGRLVFPRFCPWCGGEVLSLIGKEIDGYRIDRVLAEGGFGILYLASNLAESKMQMVVKFLRPQMGYQRPELVRVFVEEARLTEEIGRTCWNVVRVHSVRDRPWPYFLEEYIRGTTLQEAINSKDDGLMDLGECKGYLRGMAKALVATHEHGRVHRDLKPQNVMVSTGKDLPENRVKLLDFGLSLKIAGANNSLALQRLSASTSGEPVASPLEVAGTPEYMPPEAFDGMNDFTGDIYSFGVTAYEVLTGRGPWDDPPPGVDRFFYWRDCHKSKPPRLLRELRPDVPGWLAKVIARCLEKDKARRIATAQELLSELRDPIPFWVKPLAAAGVICVAVLAYIALFKQPPTTQPIERWERADGTSLDGSTLWVSSIEDLAGRKVFVSLPGAAVKSCEASDPRILPDISTSGRIEFAFAEGEDLRPLLETKHGIRGSAEKDGKTLQLQGELEVKLDDTRPRIASPVRFHPDPSSKGELQPGLRLRSSVGLSVEVEEAHPRDARLEADGQRLSLSEEEESAGAGKVRYDFDLPKDSRTYRMTIVAVDHAGNEQSTEPFELTVDNEVAMSILRKDRQSYVAAGMAIYEMDLGERLSRLEARSGTGGTPLETVLYERPADTGELRSIDVATLIARNELERVEVADLQAGTRYLLAVKPPPARTDPPPPNGGKIKLELHAADRALPQNQLPDGSRKLLVEYSPPPLPRPEDIQKVSVEFQDGDPVRLDRDKKTKAKFLLPAPRRSDRVHAIVIDVAEDTFQSAWGSAHTFSREEGAGKGAKQARKPRWEGECDEIGSTRIVFKPDLVLEENEDTNLVLTFRDGLSREEHATVILRSDTLRPRLEVYVASPRRTLEYHEDETWEDLKLHVRSNEPLRWASATLQGLDLEPTQGEDREWDFRFHPGSCKDGPYTAIIKARDLAGNEESVPHTFVLNSRPPEIKFVAEESGPNLQLKSDDLVLKITDGNELSYKNARVSVEWYERDPAARKKTKDVRITPPTDGSPDHHLVRLSGLGIPPVCKVEITARIADSLGKPAVEKRTFEMARARDRLPPTLTAHGLEWVQIGDTEFYITRHEVSLGAYNAPGFIENGRYVDPELVARIGGRDRPLHWGVGENPLPRCELAGSEVEVEAYPVVGITPDEAVAFARRFGARLPTWGEWQMAASPSDRLRDYPWKKIPEGRLCANLHLPSVGKDSPFYALERGKWYTGGGSPMRFRAVEVTFDVSRALGEGVLQKLDFTNELLHMIGNVGELVTFDEKASGNARYRVAGGDFETKYEMVSIQNSDVNPRTYSGPNESTGFRMVGAYEELQSRRKDLSP